MPKIDPRLKNFTAKKELIAQMVKMFDLDTKQLVIKSIPKQSNESNKTGA